MFIAGDGIKNYISEINIQLLFKTLPPNTLRKLVYENVTHLSGALQVCSVCVAFVMLMQVNAHTVMENTEH